MKIQEQDLFHGAPLMQIVEDRRFTALNKPHSEYGHYLVNDNRQIFVKYSKALGASWQFTFSPSEIAVIAKHSQGRGRLFVILVCGSTTICALSRDEVWEVLDAKDRGQQWIRVRSRAGGSMRVSGSLADLPRSIPHNSFPDKVLR